MNTSCISTKKSNQVLSFTSFHTVKLASKIEFHNCIRFVRSNCCLKFVYSIQDEEKKSVLNLNSLRCVTARKISKYFKGIQFGDFQHVFRVMALETVLAILVLVVIYFYIFTARDNQKTMIEIFVGLIVLALLFKYMYNKLSDIFLTIFNVK